MNSRTLRDRGVKSLRNSVNIRFATAFASTLLVALLVGGAAVMGPPAWSQDTARPLFVDHADFPANIQKMDSWLRLDRETGARRLTYSGRDVTQRTYQLKINQAGPDGNAYLYVDANERARIAPNTGAGLNRPVELRVFFIEAISQTASKLDNCGLDLRFRGQIFDEAQIRVVARNNGPCPGFAQWAPNKPRYNPNIAEMPYVLICKGECPLLSDFESWVKQQFAWDSSTQPSAPPPTSAPTRAAPKIAPHKPKTLSVRFYQRDNAAWADTREIAGLKLVRECREHRHGVFTKPLAHEASVEIVEPEKLDRPGWLCLVLAPASGPSKCYIVPYTPLQQALDIAFVRLDQLKNCPRPEPLRLELRTADGRASFSAHDVLATERLDKSEFQLSETGGSSLTITALGFNDPRDVPVKELFRHHEIIGSTIRDASTQEVWLKPRYFRLEDIRFVFRTSAGQINDQCEVSLIIPQALRLGDGWRLGETAKDIPPTFDTEKHIILYNGPEGYLAHPRTRSAGLLISTAAGGGELTLQFTGTKCRSQDVVLRREEIDLGLIERETRPADWSLLAVVGADVRLHEVVGAEYYQRFWEEALRLVNDAAKRGPAPNAAWERVTIAQKQGSGPLDLWVAKAGNDPIFANDSARIRSAERLAPVDLAGQIRPVGVSQLGDVLVATQTSLGFHNSAAAPTLLIYVTGLVEDRNSARDSICARDGRIPGDWAAHRLFAIELVTRDGREWLRNDLEKPRLSRNAPEGVYDCARVDRQLMDYVALEVPLTLPQSVRSAIFRYVSDRLHLFAGEFTQRR